MPDNTFQVQDGRDFELIAMVHADGSTEVNLPALQADCARVSHANGFREVDPVLAQKLARVALIGFEVGELVEAVRKPGPSDHCPEISGEAEELADIVIRCLDYAAREDLDLTGAILRKHGFNKGRGWRHGGKLA